MSDPLSTNDKGKMVILKSNCFMMVLLFLFSPLEREPDY